MQVPLRMRAEVEAQEVQCEVDSEHVAHDESQAASKFDVSRRSFMLRVRGESERGRTVAAQTVGRDERAGRALVDARAVDEVAPGQAARALEARPARRRVEVVDAAGGALGGESCEREGSVRQGSSSFAAQKEEDWDAPSQTSLALSYTHPLATLVPFPPDPSHTPVFESTATHAPPGMSTFGLLHERQPSVPALKHDSHSGLQSTHDDDLESQKVREAHVTNVPLVEAAVAVVHLVPSDESGWSPAWHVRQVPEGEEHEAQEGSQAAGGKSSSQSRLGAGGEGKTGTHRGSHLPSSGSSPSHTPRTASRSRLGSSRRCTRTSRSSSCSRRCRWRSRTHLLPSRRQCGAQKTEAEEEDALGSVMLEMGGSRHRPEPVMPSSQSAHPAGHAVSHALPKKPASQSPARPQ